LFPKYLLLVCLLVLSRESQAQWSPHTSSNERSRKIATRIGRPIQLDTCSILPGSLVIRGVPASGYRLDEVNATLEWLQQPVTDSVLVYYRVFRTRLNQPAYIIDYTSVQYNFLASQGITRKTDAGPNWMLFDDLNKLDSRGSIGRAISFGNSQDAVLNATLNLQLHGYIGDSLELTAALTDNNMPIQPDGNTAELRDFDRILLEIGKKQWKLSMGDIDVRPRDYAFVRFSRRIQGLSFTQQSRESQRVNNAFQVSASVAKGKYNRAQILAQDGNQGPYRLPGANNELFFVVLAGTERVFIDGVLMQRGEDQDYVINYNTAEITFTPRQMINRDKRIQVEFEYADRNYLNTQLWLNDRIQFGSKASVRAAVYLNTDARNAPIDLVLTDVERQLMFNVGDSIQNARILSAFPDTLSPGKLLYRKVDTVYNGNQRDSVFLVSADPSVPLYSVSFSYVGPGKGNYRPLLNGSNAKVFQWVQPDNAGNRQGEYEPTQLLVTPKQLRIISVGTDFRLGNTLSLDAELSHSRYDQNLFSTKDRNGRDGFAGKIQLHWQPAAVRFFRDSIRMQSRISHESVSGRFKTPERLRTIEFYRDWTLEVSATQAAEWLSLVNWSATTARTGQWMIQFNRFQRGASLTGYQQQSTFSIRRKAWGAGITWNNTRVTQPRSVGVFSRPSILIHKQWGRRRPVITSASFTGEIQTIRDRSTDTLDARSFQFLRTDLSIRSDSTSSNPWELKYYTREDYLPVQAGLVAASRSQNLFGSFSLLANPNRQFKLNAGYRYVQNRVLFAGASPSDQSLIGRIDYTFQEWNGLISGNVFYELGSGQEQQRAFTFVAVPVGQGTHTWIDYNGNGLEELNEFEEAYFPDQRKYIRIFTPTNTFVRANSTQLNYTVSLLPAAVITNKKSKLKSFIAKINLQSTLQAYSKYLSGQSNQYNPLNESMNDSVLIAASRFFTHSLFFNRNQPRWGLEVTRKTRLQKVFLNYGFETRNDEQLESRLRIRLRPNLQWQLSGITGEQSLTTTGQPFQNRNYRIRTNTLEPSLVITQGTTFRCTFRYVIDQKQNRLDSVLTLKAYRIAGDIRINGRKNSAITAKVSNNILRWNAASGLENSAVGFVMLEGLRPGKNWTWQMEWTKVIGKNLECTMQYEGRSSQNNTPVHIGRASVRALL
jgi:hypothetical protein